MISYAEFVRKAYKDTVIPSFNDEEYQIFYLYLFGWIVFFLGVFVMIGFVLRSKRMEQVCKNVEEKKLNEIPCHAVPLLHHIGISIVCVYHILHDYWIYNYSGGVPFDENHYSSLYAPNGVVPFTIAYFISDCLIFAIPEALKSGLSSKLFLFHHVLALGLIYSSLCLAKGILTQVFPCMMASELSTVFYNLAWLLRAFGLRDSKIVSCLEMSFAVLFLVVRNFHLTFLIFILWDDLSQFGVFQFCIVFSITMQYFWGYKIVRSVCSRLTKSKKLE